MEQTKDDFYRIPLAEAEGEFRDRGSKFIGFLAPVRNEEEALTVVEQRRKVHPKCNHHCYAYRIGEGQDRWRANDDGEPSGTAGKPILGQITKAEISDVVIVVSRYFGGTKLGASGLINAYREGAKLAVETAEIGKRELTKTIEMHFGYDLMTPVMSAISKLGLELHNQDFGASARVVIKVARSQGQGIERQLRAAIGGVYLEEADEDFTVDGLEIVLS